MTAVTLGGVNFSYSKRRPCFRCGFVCGGLTGLHPSGKWSTWSPGRFAIPKSDEEFQPAFARVAPLYGRSPKIEGGFYHVMMDAKIRTTCANCQFICAPDRAERERRYALLAEAGVVIQRSGGLWEPCPQRRPKRISRPCLRRMRALYEDVGSAGRRRMPLAALGAEATMALAQQVLCQLQSHVG